MSDWYEKLSQEEKEEIETGLYQANNNEFIAHEDVMKVFLKYKQKTNKGLNLEPQNLSNLET